MAFASYNCRKRKVRCRRGLPLIWLEKHSRNHTEFPFTPAGPRFRSWKGIAATRALPAALSDARPAFGAGAIPQKSHDEHSTKRAAYPAFGAGHRSHVREARSYRRITGSIGSIGFGPQAAGAKATSNQGPPIPAGPVGRTDIRLRCRRIRGSRSARRSPDQRRAREADSARPRGFNRRQSHARMPTTIRRFDPVLL